MDTQQDSTRVQWGWSGVPGFALGMVFLCVCVVPVVVVERSHMVPFWESCMGGVWFLHGVPAWDWQMGLLYGIALRHLCLGFMHWTRLGLLCTPQ